MARLFPASVIGRLPKNASNQFGAALTARFSDACENGYRVAARGGSLSRAFSQLCLRAMHCQAHLVFAQRRQRHRQPIEIASQAMQRVLDGWRCHYASRLRSLVRTNPILGARA